VDADFQLFMGTQYSSTMFFIIIVIGNVFFNLSVFRESNDYVVSLQNSLYDNFLSILRIAVILCPVYIWSVKKDGLTDNLSIDFSNNARNTNPYLPYVQAAYPVVLASLLAIRAVAQMSAPRYLPLFGLRMLPYTIFFLIRDTRIEATLTAFGICLALTAYTSCVAQSWDSFSVFLAYGTVSIFTFYDTTRQHRRMFLLLTKLQDALKVNEQLAVDAQALELRAMIGNVAHDLKTVRIASHPVSFLSSVDYLPLFFSQPLTALISSIEYMSDVMTIWGNVFANNKDRMVPEARKVVENNFILISGCLNSMRGTNSFMTMTINRCLDYTKASKGFKLVPKFETVSLQAALEMPVQLMRDVQDTIEISVVPLSAEVCQHVITDKQWLIENLLCLLSNAVKYSHKGCVQVSIRLEEESSAADIETEYGATEKKDSQSMLRVEVQDTGIGLSDEAQKSLFNPFKQAQRLAGGTGLGLFSLAKRVEALDGQYGVNGRPDNEPGSLFWFTIPFRPDHSFSRSDSICSPTESPQVCGKKIEDPHPPPTPRALPVDHLSVLVVDDAPMIVKMTTMLLQRKGHTVQHAVNGADALEKLLVRMEGSTDGTSPRSAATREMPAPPQFDVVLMDLQMPVLDGIEAIRRLRAAEARRDKKYGSSSSSSEIPSNEKQFVIALSANSDMETQQEALAAGADLFISKPFTYEGFIDAVSAQGK